MPAPPFRIPSAVRVALAWTGRGLLGLFFAAGLTILVGRHYLMPQIAGQRAAIEQRISAALGLPVKVAALTAEWPGLYPRLTIDGLQILDPHAPAGPPALALDHVEAEVGWSSLWHFGVRLHRLEIVAPALDIRRDAAGVLYVAGLPVRNDGSGGFADWLLAQGRIVVRDARLSWRDELRGAPPLELRHVNFDLRNFGWHHRFGLTAAPPAAVARRLDLRGKLAGGDAADLAGWHGELYADLDQADLTAWQPWLDLPLEWSRGRGGVRAWLDFADRAPTRLIADLQLSDVAVRLRPDLPALNLEHLDGRIGVARAGDGYAGEIRRLALATRDGIVLPPTDARLSFAPSGGALTANSLDLAVLAALGRHLPLPAQVHDYLDSLAPRGRLADLDLRWEGAAAAPAHWQAKARFADLGMAAHNELPGFAGISGSLEGDDKTGKVRLDSRDVRIELPAVFADPTLALAQLEAEAGWRARGGALELQLARAAFHNADASGEASGSYRYTGRGPGEIDLAAKLTQATGSAVWRYMPLVVNKDARDWLRAGIVGGVSENATLRLKGPLAAFPFRDGKSGIFQVKGRILGASLDFAPGWPRMTGIDGELLFEGVRMEIRARRAEMMGVGLSDVLAEIPDLESHEETLRVRGHAQGATQRFLDFVEASPVGARIDHFTQPMAATGGGTLDLAFAMPLRNVAATQVDGHFRFADNTLRVLPELPPLTAAQGEFAFTADRLEAKGLRARLFGAPLGLAVQNIPGGGVRVDVQGKLAAQALRQEFALTALDHLSGETAWRASVTVKKPSADVRVDSSLEGLSSSLPEPFNKSARVAVPLKVTGHLTPQRDEWSATLGTGATARLLRSGDAWRGRIALGDAARAKSAPPLPERGVTLALTQPEIDLDAWRAAFPAGGNGGNGSDGGVDDTPSLTAVDIRSPALHALRRDFHDVRIGGARSDGRWRFDVGSREARGQIDWDGAGKGRIAGHLAFLDLPPAAAAEATPAVADATQDLPAVALAIDNLRLHDMALGAARIDAANRDGAWQATLDVKNDAAHFAGEGRWRPGGSAPETALTFKLDVEDGEKLIARLGLPDAVRRGEGRIEGDLNWRGAPTAFELATLSGRVRADVGKGQFKKLEPGVGRLLGVLSLQSLPRRITLDFRDIFSEGFAFDSIVGDAAIDRGTLKTDELKIRGPAAKILLSGQVDLVQETQDLKVRVQPAVGESIAVGAMLAHPVAGAVAWAAQKILNDPLDQAFAYEYAVTGGWNDPRVEKLNNRAPAAQKDAGQ